MEMISRILIADDDEIGREALKALLFGEKYDLFFASSGAECLRLAEQVLPDLILLDIMMPGMDGFETCRCIRSTPLLEKTPVVLITALDDEHSRIAGFHAGADDFISKPFNRVELLARVRTITQLNRSRSLMAERMRFESLVRLSPNGILVVDAEGKILLVNPAGRLLLQPNFKEGANGRLFTDYLLPEYHQVACKALRRTVENAKNSIRLDVELGRADENALAVEMIMGAIEWEGKPAAQVILQDISQRKEMERKLSQQLANQTRELAALYAVTMLKEEAPDIAVVLPQWLEKVVQAMRGVAGFIMLKPSEGGKLNLAASWGFSDEEQEKLMGFSLGEEKSKVWESCHDGVFYVNSCLADGRIPDELKIEEKAAYLGTLIQNKAQRLGILAILRQTGQTFAVEDAALISNIADQIAIVLENARLRKLGERTVIIEERQRLARDLHDSVAQSIFSLSLFAHAGNDALEDGDMSGVRESLDSIKENALKALKEMRLLLYELLPSALEEQGLVTAIQNRIDTVERRAGLQTIFNVRWEIELPLFVQNQLYHILSEGLNNSLRYARAQCVKILLEAGSDGVRLRIIDDGIGFEIDSARSNGFGLKNMQERMKKLGGRFRCVSQVGQGTEIRCEIGNEVVRAYIETGRWLDG